MNDVFPTANEARAGARNNVRIYNEIRDIELAILTTIEEGELSVEVTNSYMTSAVSVDGQPATGVKYAEVWLDQTDDRSLAEQMLMVERHFRNLGYTITRKLNGTTFKWEILW